jgi:hypothetical protein
MTDLPPWVYDVVMALEKWEEHPRLFAEYFSVAAGEHVMQPTDECGCAALQHVPKDVRDHARTLATYLAARGSE